MLICIALGPQGCKGIVSRSGGSYLWFPTEAEYLRMSHETLVSLAMSRDRCIKLLKGELVKAKASSGPETASQDDDSAWRLERKRPRCAASHLTIRGSMAVAARRNVGSCSARVMGTLGLLLTFEYFLHDF